MENINDWQLFQTYSQTKRTNTKRFQSVLGLDGIPLPNQFPFSCGETTSQQLQAP